VTLDDTQFVFGFLQPFIDVLSLPHLVGLIDDDYAIRHIDNALGKFYVLISKSHILSDGRSLDLSEGRCFVIWEGVAAQAVQKFFSSEAYTGYKLTQTVVPSLFASSQHKRPFDLSDSDSDIDSSNKRSGRKRKTASSSRDRIRSRGRRAGTSSQGSQVMRRRSNLPRSRTRVHGQRQLLKTLLARAQRKDYASGP
jgi:hypothetical protein